jgi:excisionase family DNA binding protein
MGAYLSARESADYCGVSEKTIRNWIAAGRLSAEKSAGTFRIDQEALDVLRSGTPRPLRSAENGSAEVRAEGSPQGAESAEPSAVAELVTLVRDLQAQLVTTASTAAMWQERAGMLSDRLALAEAKIAALEAPREQPAPPESPVTAQETASPGRDAYGDSHARRAR